MDSRPVGPDERHPKSATTPPPASQADIPGPVPDGRPIPEAGPAEPDRPAPRLGPALLRYSLLRFGLLLALAGILVLARVPLLMALLLAVIVALPLAWLVFAGPRLRANEAMAAATGHRRAERERLRAALEGSEGG